MNLTPKESTKHQKSLIFLNSPKKTAVNMSATLTTDVYPRVPSRHHGWKGMIKGLRQVLSKVLSKVEKRNVGITPAR